MFWPDLSSPGPARVSHGDVPGWHRQLPRAQSQMEAGTSRGSASLRPPCLTLPLELRREAAPDPPWPGSPSSLQPHLLWALPSQNSGHSSAQGSWRAQRKGQRVTSHTPLSLLGTHCAHSAALWCRQCWPRRAGRPEAGSLGLTLGCPWAKHRAQGQHLPPALWGLSSAAASCLPAQRGAEQSGNPGTLLKPLCPHSVVTGDRQNAVSSQDNDIGQWAVWGTGQEESSGAAGVGALSRPWGPGQLAGAGLTCRRKESSSMLGFWRKKFWRSRSRAFTVFSYST